MSTISAGTTTTTALVQTGDTTGSLVLQTGSTPTTAMTISSSQIVNFANAPTVAGAALPSGAMTLISTQTVSNVTGVTFNNISSTYNNYELIYQGVYDSSNTSFLLRLQMVCSGTIDTNGIYFYGNVLNNGAGTSPTPSYGVSASNILLTNNAGSSSTTNLHNGKVQIYTFSNNVSANYSIFTTGLSNSSNSINSGVWNTARYMGSSGLNQTVTGIYLYDSNGAYMNGTFSLYGILS